MPDGTRSPLKPDEAAILAARPGEDRAVAMLADRIDAEVRRRYPRKPRLWSSVGLRREAARAVAVRGTDAAGMLAAADAVYWRYIVSQTRQIRAMTRAYRAVLEGRWYEEDVTSVLQIGWWRGVLRWMPDRQALGAWCRMWANATLRQDPVSAGDLSGAAALNLRERPVAARLDAGLFGSAPRDCAADSGQPGVPPAVHRTAMDRLQAVELDQDAVIDEARRGAWLRAAIQRLSRSQRAATEAHLAGEPQTVTAVRLGISHQGVADGMRRAEDALKKMISEKETK